MPEFDNELKLTNPYGGDWFIIESFKGKIIHEIGLPSPDSMFQSARCTFEVTKLEYKPKIFIAPKEKKLKGPVIRNAKFQNVNIDSFHLELKPTQGYSSKASYHFIGYKGAIEHFSMTIYRDTSKQTVRKPYLQGTYIRGDVISESSLEIHMFLKEEQFNNLKNLFIDDKIHSINLAFKKMGFYESSVGSEVHVLTNHVRDELDIPEGVVVHAAYDNSYLEEISLSISPKTQVFDKSVQMKGINQILTELNTEFKIASNRQKQFSIFISAALAAIFLYLRYFS
jgi:hypothetical protein